MSTSSPWEHFSMEELRCRHCNEMHMKDSFMQKLVLLRKEMGVPLSINSGYRCPEYNAMVSSSGFNGPHTTGQAVDIAVSGYNAFYLISKAKLFGFSGVGVMQRGDYDKRFIHLDDLYSTNERPRPHVWSY